MKAVLLLEIIVHVASRLLVDCLCISVPGAQRSPVALDRSLVPGYLWSQGFGMPMTLMKLPLSFGILPNGRRPCQ